VKNLATLFQTLGQTISCGEADLKVLDDVPRAERRFLHSKLFSGDLEDSWNENGFLSESLLQQILRAL
jgi:hypothetical protein